MIHIENQIQIKKINSSGNGGSFYIESECESEPPTYKIK